jgi:3-oxoadipate enol-lactonase
VTDETPLAHDDLGTGRPVVLLHAGIADRRMWRAQVSALRDGGHRAIAVDLTGYGDSAIPARPFAHHDRVVDLLDRLGIGRAVVVGCSFGGRVALDLALAHPDRVDGLALFGAVVGGHAWSAEMRETWDRLTGDPQPDDIAATAAAEVRFWVVGPGRRPDDVDAELRAFALELDRRALAAEVGLKTAEVRELDPPAIDRLAEIAAPTLVAAGADDVLDIRTLADRLAADIPHACRLPDVPDAAHLLPLERPATVNTALLAFLKALPAQSPQT